MKVGCGVVAVLFALGFVTSIAARVASRRSQDNPPQTDPVPGNVHAVDPRRPCSVRASTNPNNTMVERMEATRRAREDLRSLRWPHSHVDLSGGPAVAMVLLGAPACDDATLNLLFDNRDPNWSTSAEVMCSALGFERIECTARDGSHRTIMLDSVCDCALAGRVGGCLCDLGQPR